METIDEEFVDASLAFIDRANREQKPFFMWFNSSRMHIWTRLKPSSQGVTGLGIYPDGMVEHDGQVGQLLKKLDDLGIANNTIVIYTTDNGAETFSWPDGGATPFRGEKNTNWEGGYRVPAMVRWPGLVPARSEINDIFSAEDWATTLVAAAGEPDIKNKLLQGYNAAGKTFKVHLDGYDQRDLLSAKGPDKRREFFYWTDDGNLAGLRYEQWKAVFMQQKAEGLAVWSQPLEQLRLPLLFNLRSDPFERAQHEAGDYVRWFVEHAFVLVPAQAVVGQHLTSFQEFPPRQKPGSFSVEQAMDKLRNPTLQQLAVPFVHFGESTMKPTIPFSGINRRSLLSTLVLLPAVAGSLGPVVAQAQPAGDGLPSWNEGAAKQAILGFVRATVDRSSPTFVPPEERIAVFDQDGTLWVEHPMYSQVVYCLDRVPDVVAKRPGLKNVEPFKTVLSGNREAMAKLPMQDLEKILAATLTGMTVEEFNAEAKKWLETARDPRWKRPYTELVYQPMLEVLRLLRDNGFKTYIVTGGGQDFVRVYSERVYGIPPEQVVGTAGATKFAYAKDGKPIPDQGAEAPAQRQQCRQARRDPSDDRPPACTRHSAIRPATGRCSNRPRPATGARLKAMLVLHDDADARIRLRPGSRPARHQGRRVHPGALRRGHEERLDGDQHEERLEAHLPF